MSPAPGGVAWRCFWKERTEAWRPAQGLLDSRARPLGPGRLPLLLLFFVLFGRPPDALRKPTRELGEALLIWARTRASPQAVARTQRTGKSRGRMGRTPFTWESGNHADGSQRAAAPGERGRAGLPSPRGQTLSGKGTEQEERRKGSRRS